MANKYTIHKMDDQYLGESKGSDPKAAWSHWFTFVFRQAAEQDDVRVLAIVDGSSYQVSYQGQDYLLKAAPLL